MSACLCKTSVGKQKEEKVGRVCFAARSSVLVIVSYFMVIAMILIGDANSCCVCCVVRFMNESGL